MAWFTKKKPLSPDAMGMHLARAAADAMADDPLKPLAPALDEATHADFEAERLLLALFPFDLAVALSGSERAADVRGAMMRHSVEAANVGRRESGRPLFTETEWRDRAAARFRQYAECLAPLSGPDPEAEPMYLLGRTAVQNLTGASNIALSLVTPFSVHFTRSLIFARKAFESMEIGW